MEEINVFYNNMFLAFFELQEPYEEKDAINLAIEYLPKHIDMENLKVKIYKKRFVSFNNR